MSIVGSERVRLVVPIAAVLAFAVLGCASIPLAEEPTAPSGAHRVGADGWRAHTDGQALRRSTFDAGAALLRDDRAAFIDAATAMKRASRPLPVEAAEKVGDAIRGFDVAFHSALDRVREDAADDDMTKAFDDFFWVQRTCRSCHAQARERGMLPESGPLWRPDGTPFRP